MVHPRIEIEKCYDTITRLLRRPVLQRYRVCTLVGVVLMTRNANKTSLANMLHKLTFQKCLTCIEEIYHILDKTQHGIISMLVALEFY